jgi:hypothetical protein
LPVLSGNEHRADVVAMRRSAAKGGDHILVTRQALARILDRHLSGAMTAADLVEIANELESNDEVDYEGDGEAVVAQVLFELASPEINGPLTPERSRALRGALVDGGGKRRAP